MDLAWNDYVSLFFLVFGAFFALTGAIGVIRMPDFYSRIHPAGKSDTLGLVCIMVGLAFQLIESDFSWSEDFVADPGACLARIVLIIIMVMITAPTATHAITKAAHLEGLKPWTVEGDEEGQDNEHQDSVDAKEVAKDD